ncbi:fatty acid desaturase family protein [Synechococcus sp. R55.6]|jgi:fatty acid desaturase|uniref:fatty acid desaturase family protein n=1 Tax=unclassified Synechococcus TaxID=2626047 RepID=UPI0000695441|nr:fatty acid desaturase family protein [Synechococcus sp. JA-2-3B'a(2-13)]ABD03833.1 fatty acid desaturase [Synechococcus sp. JA-2-3B'a(2-13)]
MAVETTPILPDPQRLIPSERLRQLNVRSNSAGLRQLLGHLAVMAVSGSLWVTQKGVNGWIALPALVVYGASLATMFAALHECVHRTAFASPKLNDGVAWVAGLLSFYNSTFYRRYHKWHHRYTQIPGKDPELEDPKPQSWPEYLLELSGLTWWIGKVKTYIRIASGQLQGYPYIPESARQEVIRSVRLQLGIYGLGSLLSLLLGDPWIVWLWLLPLAVGQPILRFILLAEHTGCSQTEDPFSNTRTTLTLWPIRFLMWNMPYHAEHHLYPSIPFHALADAHQYLKPHLAHLGQGYVRVHRQVIEQFQA